MTSPTILAQGQYVILRDHLPSDAGSYARWWVQGEWRAYDAPWELPDPPDTEEANEEIRREFLERCRGPLPTPRPGAIIATRDGRPLGWVNRYAKERFPGVWWLGIDICEDDCLNQGLGTEALGLWIDYLFGHSDVHRLSLDTWSFNPRMMRVAQKLGFEYEGRQRALVRWQGQWLDLVHFGLLRSEVED